MIPPNPNALVVAGPGLVADLRLLTEVADREFAALGVSGKVVSASDLSGFRDTLDFPGALVVLPGPDPEIRGLYAGHPQAVWLDVTKRDTPLAAPVDGTAGTHLHGRGIWGLAWAIRHAVHRLRWPARRVAYGDHPDQWADVRLPREATGSTPVAVLLHGGYWRSIWGADLMDALCVDLAERGFAAWNLEYRSPDLHGWGATTEDVARAIGRAAEGASGQVVAVGHSTGGQLALRAAADDSRISLAVSLAGVLDLVEGDRRHLSSGAVAAALGGPAAQVPEVYGRSSPLERLPLGTPQLIVQGGGDDLDLVDLGRQYARAAQAAGDQVTYLEMSGDHFDVIDPASPIWRATAGVIADFGTPGPSRGLLNAARDTQAARLATPSGDG
ncbi:acetyl esterase/lipase [Streptosporangium album]|uniref:Acetyl esterase/lipase n=1 Tax=Streptosporangium album TaxID=47479 RepID=A0A7W7S248_9ACTN|nr:alpha/beta hydrolase fold domain-containing protein [Streptosporangium album]MBB4942528.1 acetyl esterase/lipase [Streptosporangium album]